MSGWPIASLGSVVKFVSGGTPSKDEQRYWIGNIPWVSSAEMKQRWLSDTQLHVSEDGAKVGSRCVPKNTVLAVVRGMSLAKEFRVAITKRDVTFNQDLKALLPTSVLNPVYLFFYLLSQNHAIRDSASEAAHGTKKLDMPVLEQWPIPIPPLATQQKIAAILSTYDDLIANNQRRITLLERMAEDLYREWFVRLRFPGHEDVKVEKGVPQGWEFVELHQIATINGTSLKKGKEPERILYIDISAVTTNQIAELTEMALVDAPGRARRLVKHGDVIWSSVRPANRAYSLIFEPPENLVASTGFAVISPKPAFPFTFVHLAVTSDSFVEQMAMVAKGATYPATSFEDFGKAKLLLPSAELLSRFHSVCDPMVRLRHQLRQTNAVLAQKRDSLLPRLLSGKLSVDALDIRFPPGMRDQST